MFERLYILPTMVANRYVLNRMLRETEDLVVFGAVQRDIQRDVIVETLRPACMQDPAKVQRFLETARLQAAMDDASMACALELFFADNTWHYARESIQGESLESWMLAGSKIPDDAACELMLRLCRSCIYMDMEGVNSTPFSLADVYSCRGVFRYANPVCAGKRPREASCLYLSQAAEALLPLVDTAAPLAGRLCKLLDSLIQLPRWSRLEPVRLLEKFVVLQADIIRELISEPEPQPLAPEVVTVEN